MAPTVLLILSIVAFVVAIVAIIIVIILASLYAKSKKNSEGFSEQGDPVYNWIADVQTLPANLVKNANYRIGSLGTINAGVPAAASRSLYNPNASTSGRTIQELVNEKATNPAYYDNLVNAANEPDTAPLSSKPNAMITKTDVLVPLSDKAINAADL